MNVNGAAGANPRPTFAWECSVLGNAAASLSVFAALSQLPPGGAKRQPRHSTRADKLATRRRAKARDRVPIARRTIHSVAVRPREEDRGEDGDRPATPRWVRGSGAATPACSHWRPRAAFGSFRRDEKNVLAHKDCYKGTAARGREAHSLPYIYMNVNGAAGASPRPTFAWNIAYWAMQQPPLSLRCAQPAPLQGEPSASQTMLRFM